MANIKAAIPSISTTLSTDSVTQLCNFRGPAGRLLLPPLWQTRLRLIGLRPSHLGPSFGAALSFGTPRWAVCLIEAKNGRGSDLDSLHLFVFRAIA
jgi:hypothetical protein